MKKLFIILVLLLLTVLGIFAQELALDEAIERAARDIETEMPQRAMVLVLNLASPSVRFSDYVLEELTDKLVMARKVTVVDRQNLRAIREEMNFQYSGEVSDESMVSIGKMLGANYIVTGSLTDRGTTYRLRFRIIVVETARILSSAVFDLKKDAQVVYLMGDTSNVKDIERQQQEAERERQRAERERQRAEKMSVPKTSNVKNNWISLGLGGLGPNLKYERMLVGYFSIGVDVYASWIGIVFPDEIQDKYRIGILDIGANAGGRFYPFRKAFYIGFSIGAKFLEWETYDSENEKRVIYSPFGFAVTPELGWRVDFGYPGGFYMDFGVKVPIMFCDPIIINSEQVNNIFSIVPYIGLFGWAF